ncbi:MAG: glycosyltransferase [Gemmataceae bacterium]
MATVSLAPLPLLRLHRLRPPQRAQQPRLSVVIVNYRRWRHCRRLIRQILEQRTRSRYRCEIILVDNASPAPPPPWLQRLPVRLVRMPANKGFAAGVNAGWRHSRSPWLLVLNPDIRLPQGFFPRLRRVMDELDGTPAGKRIGVVGFQLRNADGTLQGSAGRFPTLIRLVCGLLRARKRRKYLTVHLDRPQPVPWVTGSCMMLRRRCLHHLGGLDERFFLYYEDVDLCRRAQQAGWQVRYEPRVWATHLHPLQNRVRSPALHLLTRHACLTYFAKYFPGARLRLLTRLMDLEACWYWLLARVRGRTQAARIYRLFWQMTARFRAGDWHTARQLLAQSLRDI